MQSSLVWLLLLSTALSLVLAGYGGLRYREHSDTVVLASVATMTALAAWSLAYALQVAAPTVGQKLLWFRFVELSAANAVFGWVALVLAYTGKESWITPRRFGLLASEPIVYSLVVAPTDGRFHNFMIASVDGLTSPGFGSAVVLDVQRNWWYYVNFGWLVVVAAVGVVLTARTLVRSEHRGQTAALAVGGFAPLAAAVLFNLGLFGGFDFTPVTFTVSGVAFAVAVFRYRLLDLGPIGRESVVEQIRDGYLMTDAEGHVVDFNASARPVLESNSPVGRPAGDVLPDAFEVPDPRAEGRTFDELVVSEGGEERLFEVETSPIAQEGQTVGRVYTVRDVTDDRRREQLEVLNRFLRHNVRNDLTVVQGHAELIAARVADESVVDSAETVVTTAGRIARRSSKARDVQRLLDGSADREPTDLDLGELLEERVAACRGDHPDADVELAATDDDAVVRTDQHLAAAIDEVLENAVIHAEDPPATVRARVDADASTVTVVVEDDGPGIPEEELQALDRGRETALQHGSGLGLWLTDWIVRASGGSIDFRTGEDGTTVRLTFSRE